MSFHSFACPESLIFPVDFTSAGFYPSLRTFVRAGTSVSILGLHCPGISVFVFDSQMGFFVPLQSFSRADSPVLTFDFAGSDLVLLPRSFTHLCSSLFFLGKSQLGLTLFICDRNKLGPLTLLQGSSCTGSFSLISDLVDIASMPSLKVLACLDLAMLTFDLSPLGPLLFLQSSM